MVTSLPTGVGACLEELMKKGDEQIEEVRAAEDVDQELLVQFEHFPDEDVELLGEEYLLH